MNCSFLKLFIVGAAMTATAQGAITLTGTHVSSQSPTGTKDFATAATYTSQILASDLINVGSPSLLSFTKDKTPFFESSTLNDGGGHLTTEGKGTYIPVTFNGGGGGKLPITYTFTLNVATAPEGYAISEIRSFAGWNENGATLGNQKFELQLSYVGDSSFVSLGTFEYIPFAGSTPDTASATKLVLTEESGGPIATGVDEIRFIFMDHGQKKTALDGSVYHEVDVIGQAVPEPTTALLLAATAPLLLTSRRRR